VYTSVLVIGELGRGVELRRMRDPMAAMALEQWLRRLVESYADRILPVDQAVAERWATLGIPDRLPTADGLIAATALVHDLTLVTRNVRDMTRTGVRLLDPFAES
jgi:predicted nucleic acid-binding protein